MTDNSDPPAPAVWAVVRRPWAPGGHLIEWSDDHAPITAGTSRDESIDEPADTDGGDQLGAVA